MNFRNLLVLPSVKPEVLDAYEIGFKSELFDHRLRLNAAAFYDNVSNLQVQSFNADGTLFLQNAATATSKGIDVSADALVYPGLTTHIAATFLDAKYTSFPAAPEATANPDPPYGNFALSSFNASGQQLPNSPTISLSAGVNYEFDVPAGTISMSGNYDYNNGYTFDPDGKTQNKPFGLLDARFTFSPASFRHVKVSVFGQNLTGETYYISEVEEGSQEGTIVTPGAPRTYGVTLSYDF